MAESKHLNTIIEKHNQISTLYVVFVDVEKYSCRRTIAQIAVVDALTQCLKSALAEVSKQYIEYAQANGLNFETDVIRLPTGDGAAIIFPFEGLHNIHLECAKHILKFVHELNQKNPCDKFILDGWCNCHINFNLTIGVAEGKGIIYSDINDGYNVSGTVINMAARTMGKADRNQILFTEDAFSEIVEMDEDSQLVDKFAKYEANIKHGEIINVYQFIDTSLDYLNSTPPFDLELSKKSRKILDTLSSAGIPIPDANKFDKMDKALFLEQVEGMVAVMTDMSQLKPKIKGKLGEIKGS